MCTAMVAVTQDDEFSKVTKMTDFFFLKKELFYFKRLVFKRWQAVARSCLKAESPHCVVEGGLAYPLNCLHI